MKRIVRSLLSRYLRESAIACPSLYAFIDFYNQKKTLLIRACYSDP